METGYDNAHEIHPYGFEPNSGENHTESDESESELKKSETKISLLRAK
jgi:hypothetical protein